MNLISTGSIANEVYFTNEKVVTKFEKEEEISFIISESFSSEIVILKGLFDAKIKNIDKLYKLENRDVYIFHLELKATVEYIDNSSSSSVKITDKRLLTSKVVQINRIQENLELKPVVNISYGVISNFNDILYCTVLLTLALGGTSYAN